MIVLLTRLFPLSAADVCESTRAHTLVTYIFFVAFYRNIVVLQRRAPMALFIAVKNNKERTLMPLQQNKSTLAAAIASAISLLSAGAWAADLHVTNCQNAGSHSLRAMIASAADTGDRIVFDGTMNCSTITLTSGELTILSRDLTLQGPTDSTLVIDGNHASRLINAVKVTTDNKIDFTTRLTINNLTLRNGLATGVVAPTDHVLGGCVAVGGDLIVNSSTVTGCTAKNTSGSAFGGGIFASGLNMQHSVVTDNLVSAQSTANDTINASGGGVAGLGGLDVVIASSVISGNTTSVAGTHAHGLGGGILFSVSQGGKVSITDTSILGNRADVGGGAYLNAYLGSVLAIDRSTVASSRSSSLAATARPAASSRDWRSERARPTCRSVSGPMLSDAVFLMWRRRAAGVRSPEASPPRGGAQLRAGLKS